MEKICCFAGHGDLNYNDNIRNELMRLCRMLIEEYGVREFRVGNYGSFDKTAAGVIRELKRQGFDVELNLLIPYLTKEIEANSEQYFKNYDDIIMAAIPEGTPYSCKILKCNQYMVDCSDYMVAYVDRSYGGAARTLEHAKRKKHIRIFNLSDISSKIAEI